MRLDSASVSAEIRTESYLMQGLLGADDVRILQDAGWAFWGRGVQMADCWAVWSANGDERKLRFLACPDKFPEMWPDTQQEFKFSTLPA